MKKFVPIIIITMIILQSIVLYSFFNNKLSTYPENLVNIVWMGSAMIATIFGVLFFKLNKGTKVPISTIISVTLLGLLGFQFMLSKNWIIVLIFILIAFLLHFYRYRDNKFAIFPVISSIMGIYSVGLYMLMKGITSM